MTVNNLRKKIKNEKGQVLVEYALVLPIFLLMLFSIIEIGWIGYQKVILDHTFRKTTYEYRFTKQDAQSALQGYHRAYRGYQAEEMIKSQIKATDNRALGIIDIDRLSIDNAFIEMWPGGRKFVYKKPKGYDLYPSQEAKTTYSMVTYEIDGIIRYRVPPLTPFSKLFFGERGLLLEKSLYKAKRGPTQTNRNSTNF